MKTLRTYDALAAAAMAVSMCSIGLATPPARTQVLSTEVPLPIYITNTPTDSQHIYVCARAGTVWVLDKDTGAKADGPFLDVSANVSVDGDNGLLGMAFDPGYASNGYFYVNYRTLDGSILLERYHVGPDSSAADPASAYTIWRYPRVLGHNGGWIGFSPVNHLLYITSGDGDPGSTYDFANRAQGITNQPYGKVLRIDPSSDDFPSDPDRNYHIPPGNPFVSTTGDDEIWSYGVRNPWRGSFDRSTGDFYFGDVGMDSWEEVNFEPASSAGGRDYGWPCMEGTHCTDSSFCTCDSSNLTLPIYDYPHPTGNCVIGGYVYRGAAIPAFQGVYFFADFLRAKVWSFRPQGSGPVAEFTDRTAEFTAPTSTLPISFVSSFGEDAGGELYLCDIGESFIYKIVPYPCLPVVDVDPAPQTRPMTATITLSVTGAGADPLTFLWRKNAAPLSDDGHFSGTTTTTLTIGNAVQSDQGLYDVVLTSPCGSTPSAQAQVTILPCVPADFNHSGQVTVQDIFDFLAAWFAGAPGADFNRNGQIEVQDIFDYLTAWFVGCV